MPATTEKPPQAPKPSDRAKDESRQANCQDERLSKKAGYGRADSTPEKQPKA